MAVFSHLMKSPVPRGCSAAIRLGRIEPSRVRDVREVVRKTRKTGRKMETRRNQDLTQVLS
jgi:hypothetical protein